MSTKFTAAAQAIADHFKQAEAKRGEPFEMTFINAMNNDAVTPNFVGIPVALLRALVDAPAPNAEAVSFAGAAPTLQQVADAERFNCLAVALTDHTSELYEFLTEEARKTEPTSPDDLRLITDAAIRFQGTQRGAAA